MSAAAPAAARPKAARAEPVRARTAEPAAGPAGEHALALALHAGGARAPAAPPPPPPPAVKTLRRRCGGPCDEELTLRRARGEGGAGAGTAGEGRREGGGAAGDAVRSVIGAGGGRPLDPGTRAFFEAGFGRDLRGVRVHTGAAADASARAVNARAYTVGRDVVFRAGEYAPASGEGKRLLAHELAHVAQQAAAGGVARMDRAPLVVGSVDDPAEREADAAAEAVLSGQSTSVAAAAPALRRYNGAHRGAGGAAERPLTREEEIELSQHSRGEVTGQLDPLTVTLYAYTIADPFPRPRHRAALHALLRALRRLPSGTATVEVTGHADNSGEPDVNNPLADARAAQVAAALADSGVPVSAHGEGERSPAVGNGTVRGRARNRRVDIVIRLTPIRLPDPDPVPPEWEPDPPRREPDPHRDPPPERDDRGFCARHPVICFLAGLGVIVGLGAAALALLARLGSLLAELAALGGLGASLAGLLASLAELAIAAGVGVAVLGLVSRLAELLRRLLRRGPPRLPPGDDPPDEPEERDPDVTVTFTPVRHDDTPYEMSDRIPPGGAPVRVTARVSGRTGAVPITIRALPDAPEAGRVQVNGAASVDITRTTRLAIRGVSSNQGLGPLVLVAHRSGVEAGRSDPFFVAAIPIGMEQWNGGRLTEVPGAVGMLALMTWSSDSGSVADLDRVTILELISVVLGTRRGCFATANPLDPPPSIPANDPASARDRIGGFIGGMQSDGFMEVQQTHAMIDERTDNTPIPMPATGYRMSLTVRDPGGTGPLLLTVRKWPRAGTVDDITGSYQSSAGRTRPRRGFTEPDIPIPRVTPPTPPPVPVPPRPGPPPVPPPARRGGGAPVAGTVHPRPWSGPVGTRAGSLFYVSGLSDPPARGVHTLTVAVRSGGRVYLFDAEFEVMSVTDTEVVTRSANTRPLNVAPEGDPPLILGVHTPGRLSRELIRRRDRRAPEVDAAAPPDAAAGPVHTPPADAGLPGGTGSPDAGAPPSHADAGLPGGTGAP